MDRSANLRSFFATALCKSCKDAISTSKVAAARRFCLPSGCLSCPEPTVRQVQSAFCKIAPSRPCPRAFGYCERRTVPRTEKSAGNLPMRQTGMSDLMSCVHLPLSPPGAISGDFGAAAGNGRSAGMRAMDFRGAAGALAANGSLRYRDGRQAMSLPICFGV
jgi:hypothetical protein